MLIAGGVQGQSAKHKPAVPLERTEWKLTWLGGTKIESGGPQQDPYIQLDPDSHRVSGSGGCNRLMGGYELEGNRLKFTQMAMSRMACIHGGETESAFARTLDQVTAWKIVGGKLWLLDADQHVVAKFSGVPPES
jgi:heat shock protein HslJ